MTLENMANQLLLPILGDIDPNEIKLFVEEEVVEAELKKQVSGNAKLFHKVGAFSEASTAIRSVTFVTFWLCKIVFGSHPHYVVKPFIFS